MARFLRPFFALLLSVSLVVFFPACASSAKKPAVPKAASTGPAARTPFTPPKFQLVFPVMLGIDVLEAEHFAPLAGKRVGLLTHPAGVNRYGVPTVDILRRAPNVHLVELFGPEHGIYGDAPAGENIADTVDRRTGLPAYSLYGKHNKPTKEQLKRIDVLVIDLQDIGVRSYTYNVCMRHAIEACFENHVEVMVLDRPNPLGGLKVDGPILDPEWMNSGVGAYPIPYVHGLTMGELAEMAVATPGILSLDERTRRQGRLVVIPMRGWRRSMRWPETGLRFTPTSPKIQDFPACVGYAMIGLGCQLGGFTHGIGDLYPFRGLSFNGLPTDALLRDLEALHVPGVSFRKVSVTNHAGRVVSGIYVDVTDWNAWHPTQLSFELMRLACRLNRTNPFARATAAQERTFNIHTGSTAWWNAIRRDGARVNLESFLQSWNQRDLIYQEHTRAFWLYN